MVTVLSSASITPSILWRNMNSKHLGASALKAQLDTIRQRGWAVDDCEDLTNVRCVAAPVRDAQAQVVAAISVVGAPAQIPDSRIEELAILVRAACITLSKELGFRSY